MMALHILHRHQVKQEIDEPNAQMWVANSSIHYSGHNTRHLQVKVDITAVVALGVDLLEEFWHVAEVEEDFLGHHLVVQWKLEVVFREGVHALV